MIVRINKTSDYTVMSNYHLKDKNLSLKAKGLLSMILSLPDDWKFSIAGLASISKEGKTAIESSIKELQTNGYLVITRKNPNETETGKIEYEWDFYEQPRNEKQRGGFQVSENQVSENQTSENQGLENRPQLNTNIENTNIENTKELNTKEENPLISPEEKLNLLFACFWEVYPKKVKKKDAFKAFKGIKDVEKVLPDIITDVEEKKQTKDWQKLNGQYIPYPASYLRGERWNDVNEVAEKQARIDEIAAANIDDFLL